jgi:catechol 2,3-dioxygenase-like lactoylglutathione lyase family enzyme
VTLATRPFYDGIFTPWLGVTDLGRSISWYQEMLALRLIFRADDVGWAELATPTPNAAIGLYRVDHPLGAGGATPTLGVTDLARERARLQAKGVLFGGHDRVIEGLVAFASFYDPDGNPLMFCQVLHEPRDADEPVGRAHGGSS